MDNLVIIVVIILLLLIIFWYYGTSTSKFTSSGNSVTDIMNAIKETSANNGGYTYFTGLIKNPDFSPFVYSQLMNAYQSGKLTRKQVGNLLLTMPS